MRSSSRLLALCTVLAVAFPASAQTRREGGFNAERFVASAPGAGWLVLNDLAIAPPAGSPLKLSGVIALGAGYSNGAFRVGHAAVVQHDLFASAAGAISYDRFRFSFDLKSPVVVAGHDTTARGVAFSRPTVDIAKNPDTFADTRLGLDGRLFGGASAPVRLGLAADLFVPSGDRKDYVSDATYRARGLVLFAGDLGRFTYAAQLGVHLRPHRDHEADWAGTARGHELLFGAAIGYRTRTVPAVVLGPEVFGQSSFRGFFSSAGTGVEGLVTARLEGAPHGPLRWRVKVGSGGGLHARFGAPEFRCVGSFELAYAQ